MNNAEKVEKLNKEVRGLYLIAVIVILCLAVFVPYRLGAFTEINNSALSDAPCEERGRIEEFSYELETASGVYEKKALVYLPYGYGETDSAYEVLYFYHGSKDDENTAFSYEAIVNLLDNLIFSGEIEPLIVVTPTWKNPEGNERARSKAAYEQVSKEIREALIPAVDASYQTIPTREGRSIAGVSYGAMYTLQAGLLRNYDLFDTYGTFSGAWAEAFSMKKAISEGTEKGESLNLLYASNGNKDFTCIDHVIVMTLLDVLSDNVTKGENYTFDLLKNGEHDWDMWEASLNGFLHEAYGSK